MSFISELFNRKRQLHDGKEPVMKEELQETEDELEGEETDISSDTVYPDSVEASDQEIEYEVVEREILPAKIICPDCGGITLEGLEFCDKCGGELL